MDGHGAPPPSPWCWRFRPQGKVKRRVQDLRAPSCDFRAGGRGLDLSHNESARMAVDSLLSRGPEEYRRVLSAEGEVDFLSEPEKLYIRENGRDGGPAGPPSADDQSDGSFADSQSGTQCPSLSADSDPPAGVDLSCLRGATDVLMKPSFEVYFQSRGGAAGMKDLIREFLRKATESLVIVMGSFSDVELLCDLLEASRKRNVSVHLLLDHLNLHLFVSMWQELKLSSSNFPGLSVRSVQGRTYCARTGRKLPGQITESFIISDWTQVLAGSYSFSWLSWQVHRSLLVLLKGSAALPFRTHFLRLNSSSRAVPGFVAAPGALPGPDETRRAPPGADARPVPSGPSRMEDKMAEARAKVHFLASLESSRSQGVGSDVPPGPSRSVPAAYVHRAQRNGEPLGDGGNRTRNHPSGPAQVSHVRSQLGCLTVGAAARDTLPAPRQCRTDRCRSVNPSLDYSGAGASGLLFQQGEKDGPAKTLEAGAPQKNKQQWFRKKTDFLSPCPKTPSSSTPQVKLLNKRLLSSFTRPGGPGCGPQGGKDHHQPHVTTQPSTPPVLAAHLKGCGFPSAGAALNQGAPPRPDWKSQSHTAKPKVSPRHSFLSSLYRPAWRPVHGGGPASLRRSKSLTEPRHLASPQQFSSPT